MLMEEKLCVVVDSWQFVEGLVQKKLLQLGNTTVNPMNTQHSVNEKEKKNVHLDQWKCIT